MARMLIGNILRLTAPSADHFTALMTELREQLPPDKLLTAAVALGENADGVKTDSVRSSGLPQYHGL